MDRYEVLPFSSRPNGQTIGRITRARDLASASVKMINDILLTKDGWKGSTQ
jgi:hypothetical protein